VFPAYEANPDGSCSCQDPECKGQTIGKHPRVTGGHNAATTNEKTIRTWWTQWPRANVCIRTGQVSDLVVIDVNPRNGGDDTLDDLLARYGPLPHTVVSLTGGGGRHFFFTYAPVPSGSHALGPGVDLKSDGGYIVAPPSLHKSGRRYAFERSSMVGEVALAALPEWVMTVAGAAKRRGSS
jgi:hypothetical protein